LFSSFSIAAVVAAAAALVVTPATDAAVANPPLFTGFPSLGHRLPSTNRSPGPEVVPLSATECKALLARPSIFRAELARAIVSRQLSTSDLVSLIRRCADLCDEADPNDSGSALHLAARNIPCRAVLPALFGRVAAPRIDFEKLSSEARGWARERHALFDSCRRWLAQRYPPLAHAEIWRLWPEHDYTPLKRLIAEYFGDG
jgi:hypothetical protein